MLYLIVIGHVCLWCGIIFDIVTTWSCTFSWGHSCDCRQMQNHLQITSHLNSHQTARICGSLFISRFSTPSQDKGWTNCVFFSPRSLYVQYSIQTIPLNILLKQCLIPVFIANFPASITTLFFFPCAPIKLTFCHVFKDCRLVHQFLVFNVKYIIAKGLRLDA